MYRYPYHEYTILLGATRALAHIGVYFTHRVFGLSSFWRRCRGFMRQRRLCAKSRFRRGLCKICHDVTPHVAMWIEMSETCQVSAEACAKSRRDVIPHVATWIEPTLCHVTTLPSTSQRCLMKLSVTSRRDLVFSPRMVHFGHSPHAPSLIRTLAPLRPSLH